MKKIIISLTLIIGFSIICKAQSSLNDYKYVIVPNKFDFLKEVDQYQLNSLTKFLFNKNGFTAILEEDSYPEDLASNRCLALKADVIKDKGLLNTKLFIVLKNCKNKTIYTSELGKSKEKEYRVAYNYALRDAFNSFEKVNYSYVAVQENNVEEQTPLKADAAIVVPVTIKNETKTIEEDQLPVLKEVGQILYAQEIENGFQVVDASPKVVLILLSIPKEDTFIVKGRDAIVYKDDGFWYFSENNGKSTITKTINIKF